MARPGRAPCDGPDVPQRGRMRARAPRSALVSAHDAACLPQRGQQTGGRGPVCHGGARRADRGWERSRRAVVEVPRRGAWPRAGAPPPPGEAATQAEPEDRRVDVATLPRRAPRQRVPPGVTAQGVEGDEATKPARDAGVSRDRQASPTRRRDADGWWRETGPPLTRRGATRQAAGTVAGQGGSRCAALGTRAADAPRPRDPAVVWPPTRPRRGRLVVLRHRPDPAPPRVRALGSPAPARPGPPRLDLDAWRVQRAGRVRDRPPGTGLLAGQARAEAAGAGPGQASRATRPLVRAAA
jgi:hypothetical protein